MCSLQHQKANQLREALPPENMSIYAYVGIAKPFQIRATTGEIAVCNLSIVLKTLLFGRNARAAFCLTQCPSFTSAGVHNIGSKIHKMI
jgi:hypothetical protein